MEISRAGHILTSKEDLHALLRNIFRLKSVRFFFDMASEATAFIKKVSSAGDDYYRILGVEKGASDDEIKKAYRKLALRLHPDKCKDSGAEEAFKKVGEAFSVLSDTDKRRKYDQFGADALRGGGGGGLFRRCWRNASTNGPDLHEDRPWYIRFHFWRPWQFSFQLAARQEFLRLQNFL
eukprot:Skav234483  [mRNA]  locus=scaffold1647:365328:369397:- [translate_table: standard]